MVSRPVKRKKRVNKEIREALGANYKVRGKPSKNLKRKTAHKSIQKRRININKALHR
jgi:hypothetical protein